MALKCFFGLGGNQDFRRSCGRISSKNGAIRRHLQVTERINVQGRATVSKIGVLSNGDVPEVVRIIRNYFIRTKL